MEKEVVKFVSLNEKDYDIIFMKVEKMVNLVDIIIEILRKCGRNIKE